MFTPRKRHLRKKRFFLSKQQNFALFNASNLKTSEIINIRLSLLNAKLYSVPLYLRPPKISLGCPIIMIVYDNLKDLKSNLTEKTTKMDCIGVLIHKKWYPISFFKKSNTQNQNKKLLTLLLYKKENL